MFAEIFSYDRELIEQGERNKETEIAKSMLSDDIALETIAKHTQFAIAELEALKAR